jgi:hypothetical protein
MLAAIPLFLHVFMVWWLIKHWDKFNFIITPTHFLPSEHSPVFLFDGFNSTALLFILNKSKTSIQCNSCNTIKNGAISWIKLEPPQNITKHTILKLHPHTHSGTLKDEIKHNVIRHMQNLQNHNHSQNSVVPYHYAPVHTSKTHRGSKGTTPFVLNLCSNWSQVVTLCPPNCHTSGKGTPCTQRMFLKNLKVAKLVTELPCWPCGL